MGITVFGFKIYYYGIVIALGMLIAFFIAKHLMKKSGYREDIAYHLLFLIIPFGILGARLYYAIWTPGFDWSGFFNIREGGTAIYGGILTCLLVVFIYSRFKKCGFFTLVDNLVPGVILAQSIGRWGNYFNSELYGAEAGFSFFPLTVDIGGVSHYATFFYESFLNAIGFLVLWFFIKKAKNRKWGQATSIYLMWYGTTRSIIESFRVDTLKYFAYGNETLIINRISVLISLVILISGVVLWFVSKKGIVSQNNTNLLEAIETNDEEPRLKTQSIPSGESSDQPDGPSDTSNHGSGSSSNGGGGGKTDIRELERDDRTDGR
ncbi:MAG: prolipoprotein diacylglyceryl transferase [Christensenellaceae bacterium]|jgi:phosphatidylglycerol:prolipoprotein diacylglycerol transferase|nr:prolipoprotein diacylglyceryl transferase [Christensenellaceae bacterium]